MTRRTLRTATGALAAAALLGSASTAAAQSYGRGIDAQLFKPSLDSNGIFSLERATGLKRYEFAIKLGSSYAAEPLKLNTVLGAGGMEDGVDDTVIDYNLALDFGVAFGLTDRLTFGLEVPLYLQPLGAGFGTDGRYFYDPTHPEDAASNPGTGFYSTREEQNVDPAENIPGDVRLGLKYQLLRGKTGLALQAVVYVPFGDEDVFAGSSNFTFEPKVVVERAIGAKGRFALNVSVRIREGELAETRQVTAMGFIMNDADGNAVYLPKLFVGTEAAVGAGLMYDLAPKLSVGGEVYAVVPVVTAADDDCPDGCKNGDLAGEAMLGAVFGLGFDKKLAVGAGTSIVPDAARSAGFRVFASLAWTPSLESARQSSRGDSDGDKIADGPDVCPDEPEDDDGFQDDDGCPELDNDLDGVLDAQDKCANEPEDRDGFDDDDGCPEGDNDNDNVPDLNDRCPKEPEDKDGFDDDDGCPDEDNDGDGFIDAKDQCPDEPETLNGYQDLDGCPDQGVKGGPKLTPSAVDLQGDRIEFTGKTDKLNKASQGTLDDVATEMKKAPRGTRFRIEVGVEETSKKPKDKKADQALTQKRADAVMDYLISKGVDPTQLEAIGLGSDRPIDKDLKSVKNRRVEFIRLNQ